MTGIIVCEVPPWKTGYGMYLTMPEAMRKKYNMSSLRNFSLVGHRRDLSYLVASETLIPSLYWPLVKTIKKL